MTPPQCNGIKGEHRIKIEGKLAENFIYKENMYEEGTMNTLY